MAGPPDSLEELMTAAAAIAAARGEDSLADAERLYALVAERYPEAAEPHHRLGLIHKHLGRLDAAESAFRAAIARDPQNPGLKRLLAVVLLAKGRFDEGFALYEARHALPAMAKPPLPFPEWRGEDVSGKRLLIWPEQGFGDQIMFARFARRLKAAGADVTLLCRGGLVRLFEGSLGVRTVAAEGAVEFPDPDYWVMTCSLAWRMGVTPETVPGEPYLRALEPGPALGEGFKVGLVTRGNPGHLNDANRSLPPELAARLQALPYRMIDLDPAATGARDFAETAAIVDQLDLVIAVDTAIAHLAGAMGKPTWLLLSGIETDWRWLKDRKTTPWYPSMRLYRQDAPGDWAPVVDWIEDDLRALVELAGLRSAVSRSPDALASGLALVEALLKPHATDEGARLQEALDLTQRMLPRLPEGAWPLADRALWDTGCYEAATRLGGFAEFGRRCAREGQAWVLQRQMARVKDDGDRLELLAQHRLWAEPVERAAAAQPLPRRRRERRDGRIRMGLLSSDLRHHVVGYFAQPLFRHADPRFDLHVYSSWAGEADYAQAWMAERSFGFRKLPADDREAAAIIGRDELDVLVEIGGLSGANRPGILAWRPAPAQASWMGYPHSLGLSAIDWFIGDRFMLPERGDLLLERPLAMPASWICMSPAAFQEEPAAAAVPPVEPTGRITFGTANAPYKFNPALLQAWARILAGTPGSRFMFIRPEAGAKAFQENMARHFDEAGVDPGRLAFRAIRGGVRQAYADVDIALDTFPLTGGTTTCDALWMGVPTVSLVGEAVFERLGWSILNNAGLADLGARSVDDYVRIAVSLAADRDRLAHIRRGAREAIRSRPLGQPRTFARDFYDLIARAIGRDDAPS